MNNLIPWSPQYELGIPAIDKQHQRLFELHNEAEIVRASGSTPDDDTLLEIIRRMQEYSEHHFRAEERLMEVSGYPDLENHRAAHRRFIAFMNNFAVSVEYQNPGLMDNVVLYFRKWLIGHVLKEDRAYRDTVLEYLSSHAPVKP
jgi:hemerythrin-like metal-binding protein